MDENMNVYQNPLTGRYASKEMSYNWSPQRKHSTWRRLWLALAGSEKELGLPITDKQLAEMRAHLFYAKNLRFPLSTLEIIRWGLII